MTISLQFCCSSVILEYENATDREDKFFALACLSLTRDRLTSVRGCQLPAESFWHHYWNAGIEHPLEHPGVWGGRTTQDGLVDIRRAEQLNIQWVFESLILFEKPKSSRKILSLKQLLWHDAGKRLPHNHPLLVRVTEYLGRPLYWKWSQGQQNWVTWSWSSQKSHQLSLLGGHLLGNICYHKGDSKI